MPIPKTANNVALKSYRDIAKPYDAFAEIFKSGNATRLREEFEVGEEICGRLCVLANITFQEKYRLILF